METLPGVIFWRKHNFKKKIRPSGEQGSIVLLLGPLPREENQEKSEGKKKKKEKGDQKRKKGGK